MLRNPYTTSMIFRLYNILKRRNYYEEDFFITLLGINYL
jgi:hypothetical protein